MFGLSKKRLSPTQRMRYYMTLKELNDALGFNYHGSVLVDKKFRVLEEHVADTNQLKKDLGESLKAMLKRFKKLEGKEIPVGGELFPFERLILSLKNNFLTILLSEHYGFALYLGKENLNMGTMLNIICPKIADLLESLENDEN